MTGIPPRVALVLALLFPGQAVAQRFPVFDAERVFSLGDADLDGRLSFDEYQDFLRNSRRMRDVEATVEPMFRRLDTNRDGFLSLSEYRKSFPRRPGVGPGNPRDSNPAPTPSESQGADTVPAVPATPDQDLAEGREFWSFRRPKKAAPPAVERADWLRGEIDCFLLAALESRGLAPVADATRARLLRRVTFDLIGLPPTPDELGAFLHDDSPDALATVVDRLLASPHFGERWARHWLDVARFADRRAYPH